MVTMPGGSPLSWTPGERLALVFRSVTYYVGLFVVPTPDSLHTLTMANLERAGSWTILGGAAITFLLLATFLPLVRKSGKTAWVVALIALTMAPVLNIIPLPFLQLAPYRGCLGAIGVALLWGVLFSYLTRRNAKFVVPLGAILCWYSYLTVWGGWQWRSEEVIFRRFLEVDPLNLSLRYNLVYTLRESKQYAASARELELQMQSLFGANNWDNGNRAFEIFERNNSIRRLIVQLKGNSSPVENWIAWQYSVLAELRIELKDFVGAQRAYLAAQKFNPTGNGVVAGLEKLQTLLNSHGGSGGPKN